MWALSPPLRAPVAGLFLFILRSTTLHAEPSGIEWSITTPSTEAGPRSFPVLAIHAQNRCGSAETLHLHIDAGSLRCLSGGDLSIPLMAAKRVSYIPAKRRVTSSRLPIPGTSPYIAQFNPRLPPRLPARWPHRKLSSFQSEKLWTRQSKWKPEMT